MALFLIAAIRLNDLLFSIFSFWTTFLYAAITVKSSRTTSAFIPTLFRIFLLGTSLGFKLRTSFTIFPSWTWSWFMHSYVRAMVNWRTILYQALDTVRSFFTISATNRIFVWILTIVTKFWIFWLFAVHSSWAW